MNAPPLVHLGPDALKPYLSSYLMGGFKQDTPEFDTLTVDGSSVEATCNLTAYFVSPSDNKYHLSMIMGTMLVTQVGIVHALVINGYSAKSSEVYMSEFQVTLKRQITDPNKTKVKMDVANRITVPPSGLRKLPRTFYRWKFDVGDGAWLGNVTLVFPFNVTSTLPRETT